MATDAEPIEMKRADANLPCQVLVIDERRQVADAVAARLAAWHRSLDKPNCEAPKFAVQIHRDFDSSCKVLDCEVVVFSPLRPWRGRLTPDADYAQRVLQSCHDFGVRHVVLVSSAEVYGADYCNPGLMRERDTVFLKRPSRLAAVWAAVEALASSILDHGPCRFSVLRPCYVLSGDGREFASRIFRAPVAFPLAGYDPCLQLLSVEDFASAVAAIVQAGPSGVVHVAPRQVIPLRKALRLARVLSMPIPYSLQRAVRAVVAPLGKAFPTEQMEYLRYPWTISNQKLREKLAIEPEHSSAQALLRFRAAPANSVAGVASGAAPAFDDFGMDEQYIRACGRWQLGFMERLYWRVEAHGLERIPHTGGAVLAGIHRGFMPLDGVMLVHLLAKYVGRVPRFLMHPGLVKYPHLSGFLTRLGGIIACQENADRILKQDEILGVFPEGIRGAFRMYNREIYRMGRQRDDYVKAALRWRVPIIPFVAVGPAETFPILAKIESPWWKRHTHWPFFPITPTANLIPLPTKWHIQVLEPISTDEFDDDAAANTRLIRDLSRRVQAEIQSAIDELLGRRRSVFFGSLRKHEPSSRSLANVTPLRASPTLCMVEKPGDSA